jgi:hypothetical protein
MFFPEIPLPGGFLGLYRKAFRDLVRRSYQGYAFRLEEKVNTILPSVIIYARPNNLQIISRF